MGTGGGSRQGRIARLAKRGESGLVEQFSRRIRGRQPDVRHSNDLCDALHLRPLLYQFKCVRLL